MPLFPAAKLMDTVMGVDVHAVAPIPGIPVHPYFGPVYLWHSPKFPMADVLINGMPAMTVGGMGTVVMRFLYPPSSTADAGSKAIKFPN